MLQQTRLGLSRDASCPSLLTINSPALGHYSSLSNATADVQCNTTSSILDASTSSLVDDATTSISHYYAATTNSVKPLTEDHLRKHTLKMALGHQGRQRRVKYYVESQVRLLRLQADLETRRIAEMRALVPLDTPTVDDHVIQDPAIFSPLPLQQHGPGSDHNCDEDEEGISTDNSQQGRPRKNIQRWIEWVKRRLLHRNRRKSTPIKSMAGPSCSSTPSSDPTLLSQQQPHLTNQRRHSTYDHYRDEKYLLIQQGLHGLSNPNIASALGVPCTDPYASCLASHLFLPPHRISSIASLSHLKRDSGVSVLAKAPTQQHQPKPTPQVLQEGQGPISVDSRTPEIVATRYPKMVPRRTLRDAAIRALSSDMSLFGHSTSSSTSLGGSVKNNNGPPPTTSDPCCCTHHPHHQQQQDKSTPWCCCPPS